MMLALIVVMAHLGALTGLQEVMEISKYFNPEIAVDGFFVVSGFLVYMSLNKARNLTDYFHKRMRRIYPAYFCVVLLCSIAFAWLSSTSANDYFGAQWIHYLVANLVFLNFLQPELPGVFTDQRFSAVNGALWTIKVEFMFYCTLPVLIWLMRKIGYGRVMVGLYVLSMGYSTVMMQLGAQHPFYLILERQLPGQLAFFVSGMLVYHYLDAFKKHGHILVLVAAPLFLLAHGNTAFYPLYPMSLAIMVIYFTMLLFHLGNWGRFGDFSYGMYIWHFPLIQSLIALGVFQVSPMLGIASTLIGVFTLAFLSWHWVEKPFLRRSSHYRQAEEDRESVIRQ